ncbi:hypothetical protein KY359_06765 [Candidatus Woesearchaeota archaeon]|nr:hypothetical protein [Candidatus Woesearchaeota archaeon]
MRLTIVLLLSMLLLLAGCSETVPPAGDVDVGETEIADFESCAAAGNPVMESYPRQCRHGGQTFVEEIDIPIMPPEPEELPAVEDGPAEETEDITHRAEMIAINHVQDLPPYKDFNGRNIFSGNVQVLRCPGCYDVEIEFDRDSVKNPDGITHATMHVKLSNWEVEDVTATYQET